MKCMWSAKRRIEASLPDHLDAWRSGRDQQRASKRVANVSLPRPGRGEGENRLSALNSPLPCRCCALMGWTCVPAPIEVSERSLTITPLGDRSRRFEPHRRPTGGRTPSPARRRSEPMNENVTAKTSASQTTAADPLLTPQDVSNMLGGVPAATLKRWRTQRTGPVALHIGRHVRYRRSAVETWLQAKDREAAAWMAS